MMTDVSEERPDSNFRVERVSQTGNQEEVGSKKAQHTVISLKKVQCDSKLLSGFPWIIIFKPKTIKWNCLRNRKYDSESFMWQLCTRRIAVWENIRRHASKWRLLERKQCAYFGFSKQSPLSKRIVGTELNMEKLHLQIMLSDVG
jgi:hypothetical protein